MATFWNCFKQWFHYGTLRKCESIPAMGEVETGLAFLQVAVRPSTFTENHQITKGHQGKQREFFVFLVNLCVLCVLVVRFFSD